MRTKDEWKRIIAQKPTVYAIADQFLADMVGYRKTSLKRTNDVDNLANALMALLEVNPDYSY